MVTLNPDATDFYEFIGLCPNASDGEIRMAVRKHVFKCHMAVRKHPGDEEEKAAIVKRLNDVEQVLLDPERRALYDAERPARQDVSDGFTWPDGLTVGFGAFGFGGFPGASPNADQKAGGARDCVGDVTSSSSIPAFLPN